MQTKENKFHPKVKLTKLLEQHQGPHHAVSAAVTAHTIDALSSPFPLDSGSQKTVSTAKFYTLEVFFLKLIWKAEWLKEIVYLLLVYHPNACYSQGGVKLTTGVRNSSWIWSGGRSWTQALGYGIWVLNQWLHSLRHNTCPHHQTLKPADRMCTMTVRHWETLERLILQVPNQLST